VQTAPNKILVLRGGALGDFIVTLPALALLRRRWPAAKIELVGNATAARLAQARGLLDAVHSQHEARWSALCGEGVLPGSLASWIGEYDLVINYWPDPGGDLRKRFPVREGQMFLHAEAMPARAPAASHYCGPLRTLGMDESACWFPLAKWSNPPPGAGAGIAIHPGSGSPRKNWQAENWRALIPQLPGPITLIVGEAETEYWSRDALAAESAMNGAGAPRPQTCEILLNRPLEELVAHFAGCRLFLGHDSGVSHLAAACGVPCVLLFGPTEPAMWAPPAPNVRALRRSPDVNSILVEEVRAAVKAMLSDRT
jgi:ADP-heptose:LPS heptosyltransferase